ncbi:MAG: PTS sugar transporter subunit IIB [Elusimicrobiales bacterium]|nr:PTS sugar transporter subunit IIB [Elusimicrobiales bacterium]
MIIFRVDDRLIHGQVVENWLGAFNIKHILVVNDGVKKDELRRNIMRFSTPENIELDFLDVSGISNFVFNENKNYIVLFETLEDVLSAVKSGLKIEKLNLGGIHYAKGRNFSLGKAIFLSDSECAVLRELVSRGIDIYMQAIPQEDGVKVGTDI